MTMMQPRTLPGGKRVWLDGEVADFTAALTALDPRLSLIQCEDGRWEIWRVAEDGSEHIVTRSPAGARLGPAIIQRLAENDSRRTDPVDNMIRKNDLAEKHRQDAQVESQMVALDKLLGRIWKGPVPSNVEDLSL